MANRKTKRLKYLRELYLAGKSNRSPEPVTAPAVRIGDSVTATTAVTVGPPPEKQGKLIAVAGYRGKVVSIRPDGFPVVRFELKNYCLPVSGAEVQLAVS